jgi:hypothetical protein
MKTYTITLECDEHTGELLLAIDGKEVNEAWLKIITSEKKENKK